MHDWIYLDSRKPASNSTFVPQEDFKRSRWYLRHCASGRKLLLYQDAEKESLVSR